MAKKLIIASLTAIAAAIIVGGSWYFYFAFKQNTDQQKILPIEEVAAHDAKSPALKLSSEEINRGFYVMGWSSDRAFTPKEEALKASLEDWLLERFAPLIRRENIQRATIHQTNMLLLWCCNNNSSAFHKISWLAPSDVETYTKSLMTPEHMDKTVKKQGFWVFVSDGKLLRSSNHVYDQASLQRATRAISRSFHQSQLYEFLNDVPMLKERVLGVDRD